MNILLQMEAKAVKNASSLLHFSGHRELESGLLAPNFLSPRLIAHLEFHLKHTWELARVPEGSLQTKASKSCKYSEFEA